MILALFAGAGNVLAAPPPPSVGQGGVDLHTHLLMKHGMGILLGGSPDEPARSTHWESRLTTKLSFENLEKTGLSIVVVSLYAHPILASGSIGESIDAQIDQLEAWVRRNPGWIIAADARGARDAIARGKRVLVLSVEGAEGMFDTPAQRMHWIEKRRVRIVTFLHLTADSLGAPALYTGGGIVNTPIAWLKSWFSGERDPIGVHINTEGLTPKGREVAQALIQAGVWIDLSHASDRAQADLYPRMKTAGQPALYTHTVLRKYLRSERGVSEEQLGWVKESGGVIGLIPAAEMITPKADTAIGQSCIEGFGALSAHWLAASLTTDESAVMLGSDFNAPLKGLAPECVNHDLRVELTESGFYRAEQVPFLFRTLNESPARLAAKTERFLSAWERVRPQLTLPQ